MESLLKNAKEYLIRSQNPDGSWGNGDPYICARILNAFSEEDTPKDVLDKGIGYLVSCQQDDGHYAGKTNMFTDAANTAYPILVLNKYAFHKASKYISTALIWLIENQNEDGSWSGRNKNKNLYTTTLCLRALHFYYFSGIARYKKGVEYSLEYIEKMNFYREPVSHVYSPIVNLKKIDRLDKKTEERFKSYATRLIHTSIMGGQVADIAYLLGTLKALDEKEDSAIAEEWLVSAVNEDGGFGKDLYSKSDPGTTALVILAIGNEF
ncbi:hypothetical protein CUJ83_09270 [Methanocella sp. CWC-04]|uniref:Prenyltransferase alpha-alpha toroid domain-containing protein n=1 Tax=Methanooceanicella nereidis TaxID=2052831 RepID=A0AAP2RFC1_9EURY|nr:prenyltransferase/squalene oxidase repeat-containing protein [Methanocella sp. CWC-04]MCD1295187.1 hypothetical protein [Methanocella sp. CWC-04]